VGSGSSRVQARFAIHCELYAKLLAMVIQHWAMLTSCWHDPNRDCPGRLALRV
jgi:hypothetical protein